MPSFKQKPRILVLTSTFPRWKNDTIPPFVFELSRRLTKYFTITVLAPHYAGAKHKETMDSIRVQRFSYLPDRLEKLAGEGGIMPNLHNNPFLYLSVPFFLVAEIAATIKLVKQLKPKLIHAHWIIPQGITALVVKKLLGVPYVITVHGGDIYGLQNSVLTWIKKSILQQARDITVVSSDIKKRITKIDSNLASKIEIISMGVDSKLFNPSKYDKKIKEKYNITGPFLLFVGRLVEKKGVVYLIKAMPAILKEKSEAKLLIIGSGPEKNKLTDLADKLNLSKNVIFTGAIPHSQLPKYYATANIFIGPSVITNDGDTEGFGLTFAEAIMSGCKTIGTNIGGIGDVVESKNLIRPRDPKSISNKVIELLKNGQNKKDRLSKEFVNKFDYSNIVKKYLLILSK